MADEAGGKKKGWLSKAFMGAVKLATIGVASAVAWQMFMDPLFFLPIHDPTNTTMQAWVALMNDWFGWIPELVGAEGGGGLLGSEFGQNLLEPYMEKVQVLQPEQNTEMAMDMFLQ